MYILQIPRLYNIYKETGVIENFQQMLDNIFEPLFEVTKDPSTHPQLHVLLSQVRGAHRACLCGYDTLPSATCIVRGILHLSASLCLR